MDGYLPSSEFLQKRGLRKPGYLSRFPSVASSVTKRPIAKWSAASSFERRSAGGDGKVNSIGRVYPQISFPASGWNLSRASCFIGKRSCAGVNQQQ